MKQSINANVILGQDTAINVLKLQRASGGFDLYFDSFANAWQVKDRQGLLIGDGSSPYEAIQSALECCSEGPPTTRDPSR